MRLNSLLRRIPGFPVPPDPWRLCLYATAVAGTLVLLIATRWGIGLSPDSATYIAGARGLLEGRGYAVPVGGGDWVPTTLWPPLYSIVLALPGLLGVDPLITARWLNGFLLGFNILLVGLAVGRATRHPRWLPVLGAALFLAYGDTFYVHGWAWSEPLFITTGFSGLLLIDRYAETRRYKHLFLGAGLVGLSVMARYAGAAFVLTGTILITLTAPRQPRVAHRVLLASAFAVVAGLPSLVWLWRNLVVSGTLVGPQLATRGISPRDWDSALWIVSLWFLPGRIQGPLRSSAMAGIGLASLVVGYYAARPVVREAPSVGPRTFRIGLSMILLFLAYAGLMLITRTHFRPIAMHDPRHYVPLYVATVVIWISGMSRIFHGVDRGLRAHIGRWSKPILLGICAGAVAGVGSFHSVHAFKWLRESYQQGMGYSNVSWHTSQLVLYARQLSKDTPVFSNAWDALYVLTTREVYPLPHAGFGSAGAEAGEASRAWLQMLDMLHEDGGVIVFFYQATRRGAPEGRFEGADLFCEALRAQEGIVYQVCDAPQVHRQPVQNVLSYNHANQHRRGGVPSWRQAGGEEQHDRTGHHQPTVVQRAGSRGGEARMVWASTRDTYSFSPSSRWTLSSP